MTALSMVVPFRLGFHPPAGAAPDPEVPGVATCSISIPSLTWLVTVKYWWFGSQAGGGLLGSIGPIFVHVNPSSVCPFEGILDVNAGAAGPDVPGVVTVWTWPCESTTIPLESVALVGAT